MNSIFKFTGKEKVIFVQPLQIEDLDPKGEIKDGNFSYIFSLKIQNPNQKFKAQKIEYLFEIKDKNGKEIGKFKENQQCSSILPKKECAFVKVISLPIPADTLVFKIEKVQWR